IRTMALAHGILGLRIIPAPATALDIPAQGRRGDALESTWQGEVCITMSAGRSCFLAAPSTTHLIGRTSRRVSPILARWSLSPVAGLCPSNTWHRTRGNKKILRHFTDGQISIAPRLTNGLPVFSKFHRGS